MAEFLVELLTLDFATFPRPSRDTLITPIINTTLEQQFIIYRVLPHTILATRKIHPNLDNKQTS